MSVTESELQMMVEMADPEHKDGLNIEDFINCMRDMGLIPVAENEKKEDCDLKNDPFHDIKHKHKHPPEKKKKGK